jgi:hypothetical protein
MREKMYSTYTYRNLQPSYPKLSSICRITSSLHALSLGIANLYCSVSDIMAVRLLSLLCLSSASHAMHALVLSDDAHLLQLALTEKLDTPNRATSRSLVHPPPSLLCSSKDKESSAGLEMRKLRAVPARCLAMKGGGTENVGGSGGEDDVGSADGRRRWSGWLVKEAAGGLGSSALASGGYALRAAGEGTGILDLSPPPPPTPPLLWQMPQPR